MKQCLSKKLIIRINILYPRLEFFDASSLLLLILPEFIDDILWLLLLLLLLGTNAAAVAVSTEDGTSDESKD